MANGLIFFRYYGASSHVNVSVTTPVEEFRWLTTAQALADIPVVQVVDLSRLSLTDN